MGLENFSPAAMKLYNKAVTVSQADEVFRLMARWARRWPSAFPSAGERNDWLMLLFTPWTTPAQLRVNLREAQRRSFDGNGVWICTSLMLRKGTALAALAEHDGGVIVRRFEDPGLLFYPSFGLQVLWSSIPWRFKDRRVADFFRVIVRLFVALERPEARPLFRDDPEFAELERIFRGAQEPAQGPRPPWTILQVGRELLELICRAREPRSRTALLREAVARVRRSRTGAPAPTAGEVDPPALAPLPAAGRGAVAAVRRLLRTSAGLKGIVVSSAVLAIFRGDPCPAVRLSLILDGREVVLDLKDRRTPGPCLFETRRFKAVNLPQTPVWLDGGKDRLRRLARALEDCLRSRALY
jgi:hypothetical protein